MTDSAPAVVLLFDDTQLVAQLRDALHECGARIVHEGDVASLTPQLLQDVDADVLVINLDDAAVDALETLYVLVDGDRPRLVFNDAQASAALTGWDRARWARHLAVKIFQAGDIDPPRPDDARSVDVVAVESHDSSAVGGTTGADVEDQSIAADAHDADEDLSAAPHDHDDAEALSAELEALLASAEWQDGGTDGLNEDSGMSAPDGTTPADAEPDVEPDTDTDTDASVPTPVAGLDDLLKGLPGGGLETLSDGAGLPARDGPAQAVPAAELPTVPSEWALVDDEDVTPATFGVEKQSAADYPAPDAGELAPGDEPVLNLELVSMEAAIGPRPERADVEMHLDELRMALSRLVLTGATPGGAPAALAFYAALPASTRLTFLHTQQLGGQSAADLVAQLAGVCPLAVRLASSDTSTQPGEILVVPPGHQIRVQRDARVEVRASGDELQEPSIDDSFKMAAKVFGRDAMAIVFSGHSADSVAGAKAIHAGGGQVWVETAAAEYADMVNEISAAGIVDFSGTPEALASRLTERSHE